MGTSRGGRDGDSAWGLGKAEDTEDLQGGQEGTTRQVEVPKEVEVGTRHGSQDWGWGTLLPAEVGGGGGKG